MMRRKLYKECIDFLLHCINCCTLIIAQKVSLQPHFRLDVGLNSALRNHEFEVKIVVTAEAAVTMNQNYNHVE